MHPIHSKIVFGTRRWENWEGGSDFNTLMMRDLNAVLDSEKEKWVSMNFSTFKTPMLLADNWRVQHQVRAIIHFTSWYILANRLHLGIRGHDQ